MCLFALKTVVAGVVSLGMAASTLAEERRKYDLVVYGGTSAGIAAAMQVKRMGGTVVVVEPTQRIGGLTTGGLGQTDIGNKHVIGGIAREFYQQVRQWYHRPEAWKWEKQPEKNTVVGTGQSKTDPNEDTKWTFEPSTALAIYQRWVEENDIPIIYGERLDRQGEGRSKDRGDGFWVAPAGAVAKGVVMEGNRIQALVMESGKRFEGKMFMDATYEGDLMASSGVAFTIGREGVSVYGETLNGVQVLNAKHHQFVDGVDPYVKKGNPASGLLPWIDVSGPSVQGASDHRIQAFCFRMCLTHMEANRIPFHKPEGYDESWYELLFRNYEAGAKNFPWINSLMPNGKTDTNNAGGFSTDFIGENYRWPEGSYEERKAIRAKHLLYQQGLMWTLANHPRIPENVRAVYAKWGMTKDEFTEGQGWQEQIYVREGRRMISDVVMTQWHCQGMETVEDSVGMGAYNMDSHNVQRHITPEGQVKNEGDVQVRVSPYPISYRSIVPREAECANLVTPIALSASHIAFGSIRMEPVFMILGQSGATAAMQAIAQDEALQRIDVAALKKKLLEDKQVLEYERKVNTLRLDSIPGVVVDDVEADLTGKWHPTALGAGIHRGYLHDNAGAEGVCKALFRLKAPEAGTYAVQLASWPNGNRSSKTRVGVRTESGTEELRVDQKTKPPVEGLWIPLGETTLKQGGEVVVFVSNEDADGFVVVDAVRLVKK